MNTIKVDFEYHWKEYLKEEAPLLPYTVDNRKPVAEDFYHKGYEQAKLDIHNKQMEELVNRTNHEDR